jgi:hypothetical protein
MTRRRTKNLCHKRGKYEIPRRDTTSTSISRQIFASPAKNVSEAKAKDDDNIILTMADQVRTAHLLIKHTGSRNPVSRRTSAQVTLSPDQALAELQSYEARIHSEGVTSAFPKYGRCTDDHLLLLRLPISCNATS